MVGISQGGESEFQRYSDFDCSTSLRVNEFRTDRKHSYKFLLEHAESTDIFKKQLDKFWSNQEVIYTYHSEIQGTGSRRVIN